MLPAVVSLTIDHAQTRIKAHPVAAQSWGASWSGPVFSNVAIERNTNTLMMLPMCSYEAWKTSNAGIYAKPSKSAYEFLTAGDWEEYVYSPGAGPYVRCNDVSGEHVRTVTAPGKNRGVCLEFYGYSGDGSAVCTFGWDNTDLTSSGSEIGCEMTGGGEVSVYKDGDYVGVIAVGYQEKVYNRLIILPFRKRELLIVNLNTNQGGVVVFEDIAETATTPEITPNEKFWWKPNSTWTTATVRISPLKFESSGYATSELVTFTRPPLTGASVSTWTNPVFTSVTNALVYGDKSYSGTDNVTEISLKQDDGTTNFTANGTANQARLRVDLSSDGSYTSFVYGAYLQYAGTTASTNATEEFDAEDYLINLSIEVPDDPFGTKFVAEFNEPDDLGTNVAKIRTVSNRPAKFEVGSLVLIDGYSQPAKLVDSSNDEAARLMMEVRDFTAALDHFMFRDEFTLDGFELSQPVGSGFSAIRWVLEQAGLSTSQMVLSDASFNLPEIPGRDSGERSFVVEPGETARRVIERLHQEFCADWFIGAKPSASGPRFHFEDPDDLPASAVMTLYATKADAVAAGESEYAVYSTYNEQVETVDANEIWATGVDTRTGNIVQAYAVDEASQDATTAPSSRPDNWLGLPKLFGVIDPRLRSLTDVQRAVDLLVPVVVSKRTQGEFSCPSMLWYNSDPGGTDLMLPVWRGDKVVLDGIGTVRIIAHSNEIERNHANHLVSSGRYSFGGFTNAGGVDLESIQSSNEARRANSLLSVGDRFGILDKVFVVTSRVES